ncbi:hypothetical protein [Mycobacterium sp. OTB74]|uniref:hypothetical protein n=1 Tax=Mycobacterium sp. OTB74 TaxID=1853452 RepID=UPI0024749DB8|nr:hypothetical protein [Mycobacterium sp. OTB74]MDH6246640.1 hypothetical protein [Mycobacterium sp. OTB74]
MKHPMKYAAPLMAAAAIGGAVLLAPIASADTDPTVSFGTNPYSQYETGYHIDNSPAGQIDEAF